MKYQPTYFYVYIVCKFSLTYLPTSPVPSHLPITFYNNFGLLKNNTLHQVSTSFSSNLWIYFDHSGSLSGYQIEIWHAYFWCLCLQIPPSCHSTILPPHKSIRIHVWGGSEVNEFRLVIKVQVLQICMNKETKIIWILIVGRLNHFLLLW